MFPGRRRIPVRLRTVQVGKAADAPLSRGLPGMRCFPRSPGPVPGALCFRSRLLPVGRVFLANYLYDTRSASCLINKAPSKVFGPSTLLPEARSLRRDNTCLTRLQFRKHHRRPCLLIQRRLHPVRFARTAGPSTRRVRSSASTAAHPSRPRSRSRRPQLLSARSAPPPSSQARSSAFTAVTAFRSRSRAELCPLPPSRRLQLLAPM